MNYKLHEGASLLARCAYQHLMSGSEGPHTSNLMNYGRHSPAGRPLDASNKADIVTDEQPLVLLLGAWLGSNALLSVNHILQVVTSVTDILFYHYSPPFLSECAVLAADGAFKTESNWSERAVGSYLRLDNCRHRTQYTGRSPPEFYGTGKFITAIIKASHWTFFRTTRDQSTLSDLVCLKSIKTVLAIYCLDQQSLIFRFCSP